MHEQSKFLRHSPGPTLGLVGLVLVADGSNHQLGNWIVMLALTGMLQVSHHVQLSVSTSGYRF